MNSKQKAFAEHFIRTGNAAEAARLAGYSNLAKPYISAYIVKGGMLLDD